LPLLHEFIISFNCFFIKQDDVSISFGGLVKKTVLTICLSLISSAAFAASSSSAGDVQAGEKAYGSICAACHGADLQGNKALNAPALTKYTLKQILSVLKTGKEVDDKKDEVIQMMAPIVAQLKDDEQKRKDIAAYIVSKSKDSKKK
jgi:cytochrome c553